MFRKNWIIGVTGGIAAYKTPELIRLLKRAGAEVRVVLSPSAEQFVTKLTLQAVSGHAVYDQLFDHSFEAAMGHIELAKWADHILIAPLSANRLAALAHGFADDLLTTLCLATNAQLWGAPAMNQAMWAHPATQANLEILQARGMVCLGPESGEQACGDVGLGRMMEPSTIMSVLSCHEKLNATAQQSDSLPIFRGMRILITAGPTREYLDPVRYLSNKSSGKMGYAIAEAACDFGAEVILISGPTALAPPSGATVISVESAQEMYQQVMEFGRSVDIVIGCAAVADYRFEEQYAQKIKKTTTEDHLSITLVKNPDILLSLCQQKNRPFCVGFAAETHDTESLAIEKMRRKDLDMIALNDVSCTDIGFESDINALTVFTQTEKMLIEKAPKYQVAHQLLKKIREVYDAKNQTKNS